MHMFGPSICAGNNFIEEYESFSLSVAFSATLSSKMRRVRAFYIRRKLWPYRSFSPQSEAEL